VSPRVVVVIREDPLKSHRAVEALRIALGLSTGAIPPTVVLLDEAPRLLGHDIDDIVDVEILEKHLPVLKDLEIPFVVRSGVVAQYGVEAGFAVQEQSDAQISALVAGADRVLTFG
jgi:hypothetical protein